jgi:hypothetical protein
MLSEWVRQAIDFAKISQAALARAMTENLRRQIDRAAVNKMIKGTRKVAADELYAISAITKFAAPPNLDVPTDPPGLPASGTPRPDTVHIPFRAAKPKPRLVAKERDIYTWARQTAILLREGRA